MTYDHSTHHLLSIKKIPESLIELRKELQNHPDVLQECSKPAYSTFELCIARIAQMLNIVMDGTYEPDGLFKMLTTALKNRHISAELHPHLLADKHGLKEVEIQETDKEIQLIEIGETFGMINPAQEGTGPYTVCDKCITSFECCWVRGCKKDKPAIQLERTVEILKETLQ